MQVSSPFNPVSPQGLATKSLLELVLWLGAGVFVIVAGLVLVAAIRFRARPGAPEPPQVEGRHQWEYVWIAGAVAVLIAIFIPTVAMMRAAAPPGGSEDPGPDIIIIGHQWWWEIRYPHGGILTANEVHLPVGRPMVTRLESADVIHDFWVPQVGRKEDLTPGYPTTVVLQADRPGTYLGACVEFCGAGHAWMRISVIAESSQAFDAWLASERQPPPPPATPEAVAGEKLYASLSCDHCHASTVAVGPDLTHIAARQTLAAGRIANTPDTLGRWLADPQALKPGVLMPDFRLTPDQIRDLVAYLETRR